MKCVIYCFPYLTYVPNHRSNNPKQLLNKRRTKRCNKTIDKTTFLPTQKTLNNASKDLILTLLNNLGFCYEISRKNCYHYLDHGSL